MGAPEWEALASTAEIVARVAGVRPIWSFAAATEFGLSAARWRFERLPPVGGALPLGMLSYRAAGSAWATKTVGDHAIRKRPRVGSVSFAPSDGCATWAVEGPFEVVHVYLHPATVQRLAERQLDLAGTPEIDDFFGVEDPWLAGYFQMLISELEVLKPRDREADPLLLDQSEHLLVRHLLRWYRRGRAGETPAPGSQPRANPLRPALMRRVEEYIQDNLGGEISLASLARLACMSVDHFLRSFRAACGLTPYQYVLEQRLRKASVMLRTGNAPIAAIAARCGFGNPSHFSVKFHAHFGVSPSRDRRGE
jgi:AraC family transcriptional regulator